MSNFIFIFLFKEKKITYIKKLLKREIIKILEYDKNNDKY